MTHTQSPTHDPDETASLIAPPPEPVSKRYLVALIAGYLLFFVALLGPAIIGIGVKVQTIVPADQKAAALAQVATAGSLAAVFANVIFGRISDRTTSRWGRRRIWIVSGTALLATALLGMALAPSIPFVVAAWALAQLGANAALSPLMASVADQVPSTQRGTVTAALGIALNVAIMTATYVTKWFVDNLFLLFVGPAVIALAAMIVYAFVLPDRQLATKPPRMGLRELIGTFWVNPVKHRDFAFAWWSKFLITLAAFMFTTFRLFFMQDRIGLSVQDAVGTIATGVLIYTLVLIPTAWAAGKISDKIGRRKVFVIAASAIFALGTAMLSGVTDVSGFYLVEAILGFAYGVYVGVDLALVMDVLPDPENSGKDLGVFNIANALPQTAAPMVGAGLLAMGSAGSENYTALLLTAGAAALVGALAIIPIKKVR
ncbi:MFS transporter [Arthrobacter sp. NPDC093128]|uniref:MFS transporter n=1 Tax=Arthrobacter sp. NPDC093128 TaxID=3154979 RepID=UPI003422EEA7